MDGSRNLSYGGRAGQETKSNGHAQVKRGFQMRKAPQSLSSVVTWEQRPTEVLKFNAEMCPFGERLHAEWQRIIIQLITGESGGGGGCSLPSSLSPC